VIRKQESIIIKTIARILVPFIQLFGLYVIMHGHSSPGGGFQGGVILGASFILLAIAYGTDDMQSRFSEKMMTVLTSGGVFLYAAIGVLCLVLGANFLDYGILEALPIIPAGLGRYMGMFGIELGVGITVMAVMVSIFYDLLHYEE
jgi:multicomponent Na+:H+ antiporter subunit B